MVKEFERKPCENENYSTKIKPAKTITPKWTNNIFTGVPTKILVLLTCDLFCGVGRNSGNKTQLKISQSLMIG